MITVASEQDKYRRAWAIPDYSAWSPGEESTPEAIQAFGATGTLYDFGCGDCKALDQFKAAGFDAHGIDLVALRDDVTEACLWSLPALPPRQYGFCADVLEHIPTDHVGAVLAGISSLVTHTTLLRISTIPDTMGNLIGETLHLTVRPAHWWHAQAAEAFDQVKTMRVTDDHCILVCG